MTFKRIINEASHMGTSMSFPNFYRFARVFDFGVSVVLKKWAVIG